MGANAVTGVISIFSKKASETIGTFVEAGGGTFQQEFGMAQYGGKLGKASDVRIYTKYFNQEHMLDPSGQNGADGWHRLREGFRTDSRLSARNSLMIEGDISTGREGEFGFELPSITAPGFVAVSEQINLANGAVESIWDHTYSERSQSSLQFSFDQHRRCDPLNPETRNTLEADFQHHFDLGRREEIATGTTCKPPSPCHLFLNLLLRRHTWFKLSFTKT